MDQYFVKILANIVTIDQPSVSRDPRENRELAILCLELSQSSVSPGHWCIVTSDPGEAS